MGELAVPSLSGTCDTSLTLLHPRRW
uniref:Uncharacterized protein n=1 Tax=Rhizophora mucronata TaxID=61149 RepID=A0A2P2PPD4_RHIMU